MSPKRPRSPSPIATRVTRSTTKAIAESLTARSLAMNRKRFSIPKKTRPADRPMPPPKKNPEPNQKVKPAFKARTMVGLDVESDGKEDLESDEIGLVGGSKRTSLVNKSSSLYKNFKAEDNGSVISPVSGSKTAKNAAITREGNEYGTSSSEKPSSTEKSSDSQWKRKNANEISDKSDVPVTKIASTINHRVPRVRNPPQTRRKAKPGINSWGETLSEEEQNGTDEVDDHVGDMPDSAGSQYTLKPLKFGQSLERTQGARRSVGAEKTFELYDHPSSAVESPWLRELRIGRSVYSGIFRRPSTVSPITPGPSSTKHNNIQVSWKSPRYIELDSPKLANSSKVVNSTTSTRVLRSSKTSSLTQVKRSFEQLCKDASLTSANLRWMPRGSNATIQTLNWPDSTLEWKGGIEQDDERVSEVPLELRTSSTLPLHPFSEPPASLKSFSFPDQRKARVSILNTPRTATFPDYPPILPPTTSPSTPKAPTPQPTPQLHLDHRRNTPLHKLLRPKPTDWIRDHAIVTPTPGSCTCAIEKAHIFTIWTKLHNSSSSSSISTPNIGSLLELRGQCATCKKLIAKDDPRGVGEAFSPSSNTWQRLFYGVPWDEVPCEERGVGVSKEWKGIHTVFHDDEEEEEEEEEGTKVKNSARGKGKWKKKGKGNGNGKRSGKWKVEMKNGSGERSKEKCGVKVNGRVKKSKPKESIGKKT